MTREQILEKAEKRLKELYGDKPYVMVVDRFLAEIEAFEPYGAIGYFYELSEIVKESADKYNESLVVKAPVNSSFLAYLLGATEINPLHPHYRCPNPKCHRVEWVDNKNCLFDMRSRRACICGAEMTADGYSIPWNTYLQYAKRLKAKDIVPPRSYTDLFEKLLNTHFQKSLLGAAQAVHLLKQATGVDEIDLSDREVKYRLLLGGDFSCMHPKLAEVLKKAYAVFQPTNFYEMIKLIGMAHGTQTWRNNAEDLLMNNGKCRLADIPATRDEVFMMIRDAMREHGVYDTGFAYDVANKARKGYYFYHGMDGYTIDTLKSLGFGEWFASYLLGVRYMSTKALSVLELRYIVLLTYFKMYYPKEFEETLSGEDIWENNA